MSNQKQPSENGYIRDEPDDVYKIAFNKYDNFLIAYHSEDGNDNYIITKGNGNNCDFAIHKTDFGTPAGNPDRKILESKSATYGEVIEHVKSRLGITPDNDTTYNLRIGWRILDGFSETMLDNGKININQINPDDIHLKSLAKIFNKYFVKVLNEDFKNEHKLTIDEYAQQILEIEKEYRKTTRYEHLSNYGVAFRFLASSQPYQDFAQSALNELHLIAANHPEANQEYIDKRMQEFHENYSIKKEQNNTIGLTL